MTQGICGRTYIESFVSDGPLSSWESRLRQRLALIGSTESALIWRTRTTPDGRSISRLAPSTRLINGIDSGGSESETGMWRSPTAGERRGGSYQDPEKALARLASGHTINLEDQMVVESKKAMWPTPKASAAGESSRSGDRKDEPLIGALMRGADGVEKALWVTPSARDWKDSAGMSTEGESLDGEQIAIPGLEKNRQRLDQLPRQMNATDKAMWSTPRASDGDKGAPKQQFSGGGQPLPAQIYSNSDPAFWATPTEFGNFNRKGISPKAGDGTATQMIGSTEAGGLTASGSGVTTEKRGAPNPAFPCWLMGLSDEWVSGVLRAMQSIRSSRPRSSARSSTKKKR